MKIFSQHNGILVNEKKIIFNDGFERGRVAVISKIQCDSV